MGTRVAGVLAVTGGVAWLAKVALIWRNGGTNTTDGIVGVLFDVGAVAILLALTIRVWVVPRSLRFKLVAVLAVLLAFVAVVNVPIALGWLLFGQIWLAEEVGVLLTAVSAIVLGLRWAIRGRERGRVATS
ncbi:MAG TPA: hypothetical protein VFY86_11990 [Nocardioides sp.]|nr:hypothetical protein [Nocardioides sp.]